MKLLKKNEFAGSFLSLPQVLDMDMIYSIIIGIVQWTPSLTLSLLVCACILRDSTEGFLTEKVKIGTLVTNPNFILVKSKDHASKKAISYISIKTSMEEEQSTATASCSTKVVGHLPHFLRKPTKPARTPFLAWKKLEN